MCTSTANSEYVCGKQHVLCIKAINNNKKNKFQFTMLEEQVNYLLILFIKKISKLSSYE